MNWVQRLYCWLRGMFRRRPRPVLVPWEVVAKASLPMPQERLWREHVVLTEAGISDLDPRLDAQIAALERWEGTKMPIMRAWFSKKPFRFRMANPDTVAP